MPSIYAPFSLCCLSQKGCRAWAIIYINTIVLYEVYKMLHTGDNQHSRYHNQVLRVL